MKYKNRYISPTHGAYKVLIFKERFWLTSVHFLPFFQMSDLKWNIKKFALDNSIRYGSDLFKFFHKLKHIIL